MSERSRQRREVRRARRLQERIEAFEGGVLARVVEFSELVAIIAPTEPGEEHRDRTQREDRNSITTVFKQAADAMQAGVAPGYIDHEEAIARLISLAAAGLERTAALDDPLLAAFFETHQRILLSQIEVEPVA